MRRTYLKRSRSLLVTALLATVPVSGAAANRADRADHAWAMRQRASAVEMIARLDMTSFRNSIGPRRVAGERSLAQYGFTERSAFDDGWAYAKMADGSWQFGIFVLTDGQTTKRLCVTDDAIDRGTYHATIPIEVSRQADGTWRSVHVFARLPGCVST